MKVSVFGLGYVGLANSLFFSKYHNVYCFDIDQLKINDFKKNHFPDYVNKDYLKENLGKLKLSFSDVFNFKNKSDLYFICTPTNYDLNANKFDVTSIESVISTIQSIDSSPTIIIKSTIPVGYTKELSEKYSSCIFIFSPEFLREDTALEDVINPSRIVIGSEFADTNFLIENFFKSFKEYETKKIFIMSSIEAESVKLFSNTYLAMRVSFFNELDSFALENKVNTRKIIEAVSADERIGNFYNNPSFGYGGYCLPKDTKQLLSSYQDTPQKIIESIVSSNETRKEHLLTDILLRKPKNIGFYRLVMKKNSDNYRDSSSYDLLLKLKNYVDKIYVFEPFMQDMEHNAFIVENDFQSFITKSDLVITNRMYPDLTPYKYKIYTRDCFGIN